MRRLTLEIAAEHVPHFRVCVQCEMAGNAEELGRSLSDLSIGHARANEPGELFAELSPQAEVLDGIGWEPRDPEEPETLELSETTALSILQHADGSHIRDEIAAAVEKGATDSVISLATFNAWVRQQLERLAAPVDAG